MCLIALCLTAVMALMLKIRPPTVLDDPAFGKRTVRAGGRVSDKYFKNDSYYLVLSEVHCPVPGEDRETKFNRILVKLSDSLNGFDDLPRIGEKCIVSGRSCLFSGAVNPGQFDLAGYERLKGIDLEVTGAEIVAVSGRPALLRENLKRLRQRLSEAYDRLYEPEEAGVVKSMVLGDKGALEQEIKGLYQRAGLSHILCISGLHISLFGAGLYSLLKKLHLPRAPSGIVSLTVLILYGMMTGAGVSTIRAVVMFGVLILSEFLGRTYDLLSSLAFADVVILLCRPLEITDSAFVLSFGAVLGIGLLKPVFDRMIPGKNRLLDLLRLSLSVTVFTFPLVLHFFYQIPLYSVLFNLILVPMVAILLIFAFTSGVAGVMVPAAAIPFAHVCRFILWLYESACRFNDRLPHSLLVLGRPYTITTVLYYLLILGASFRFFRQGRRPGGKERGILCTALLFALFLPCIRLRTPLTVTMLDIGQGDCSVLRTGGGRTMLIDCGSSDESEIARYKVIPYLKSQGEDTIDLAVVTHADADHISGYLELFSMDRAERPAVKRLILPDVDMKDNAWLGLAAKAEEAGTEVLLIKAGDRLTLDTISILCLHPDRGYRCEDRNEYSTVLSVRCKAFSALFTGDVEGKGEEILTERIESPYTLLKCAHHGSENSTPQEFLEKVRPVYTFISAGRENSYGHPHQALLERLFCAKTHVFITSRTGAITLRTNGRKVNIKTHFE